MLSSPAYIPFPFNLAIGYSIILGIDELNQHLWRAARSHITIVKVNLSEYRKPLFKYLFAVGQIFVSDDLAGGITV